ncbi:hypothetical protein OUZ56_015274 [Daphnia magna]|uniref:Uncharacterized protein n=1 Tax=Daphnia magna TaxID=35525 RepID=A0ABR0AMG5_9CRUS|nr:hypothetical protein OUZ56_015274 [Daphnia magna]
MKPLYFLIGNVCIVSIKGLPDQAQLFALWYLAIVIQIFEHFLFTQTGADSTLHFLVNDSDLTYPVARLKLKILGYNNAVEDNSTLETLMNSLCAHGWLKKMIWYSSTQCKKVQSSGVRRK